MSRKRTTEDFVILSTLVHGYRYDYSNSEYTGALNKVTIICENHGEFQQVATNHIRGFGCQKCWTNKLGKITLKYLSSKYKNPSNIFDGSTETFVNVDLDDFKIVFSNLI